MVDQGEITPEEAKTHPQRNVLSRALDTEKTVHPDFHTQQIEKHMLLRSDGLTEEVSEESILSTVTESEGIDTAADRVIQSANDNGGRDNISVVLTNHGEY